MRHRWWWPQKNLSNFAGRWSWDCTRCGSWRCYCNSVLSRTLAAHRDISRTSISCWSFYTTQFQAVLVLNLGSCWFCCWKWPGRNFPILFYFSLQLSSHLGRFFFSFSEFNCRELHRFCIAIHLLLTFRVFPQILKMLDCSLCCYLHSTFLSVFWFIRISYFFLYLFKFAFRLVLLEVNPDDERQDGNSEKDISEIMVWGYIILLCIFWYFGNRQTCHFWFIIVLEYFTFIDLHQQLCWNKIIEYDNLKRNKFLNHSAINCYLLLIFYRHGTDHYTYLANNQQYFIGELPLKLNGFSDRIISRWYQSTSNHRIIWI